MSNKVYSFTKVEKRRTKSGIYALAAGIISLAVLAFLIGLGIYRGGQMSHSLYNNDREYCGGGDFITGPFQNRCGWKVSLFRMPDMCCFCSTPRHCFPDWHIEGYFIETEREKGDRRSIFDGTISSCHGTYP